MLRKEIKERATILDGMPDLQRKVVGNLLADLDCEPNYPVEPLETREQWAYNTLIMLLIAKLASKIYQKGARSLHMECTKVAGAASKSEFESFSILEKHEKIFRGKDLKLFKCFISIFIETEITEANADNFIDMSAFIKVNPETIEIFSYGISWGSCRISKIGVTL